MTIHNHVSIMIRDQQGGILKTSSETTLVESNVQLYIIGLVDVDNDIQHFIFGSNALIVPPRLLQISLEFSLDASNISSQYSCQSNNEFISYSGLTIVYCVDIIRPFTIEIDILDSSLISDSIQS